jgi:hypothetical protein
MESLQAIETIFVYAVNNNAVSEITQYMDRENIAPKLKKIEVECKNDVASNMCESLINRFFEKDDTLLDNNDDMQPMDISFAQERNAFFKELADSYRLQRLNNPNGDIKMENE